MQRRRKLASTAFLLVFPLLGACSQAGRSAAGGAGAPPVAPPRSPVPDLAAPAALAPIPEPGPETEDVRLAPDLPELPPIEPGTVLLEHLPETSRVAVKAGLVLPIELHEEVARRLGYYTEGGGRSTIEAGLERAGLYRPMVSRILAEEGVPQDLLHLAQAESAFKPEAVSRALARGMWQFIAARGEEYGLRRNEWIDERSDPEKSTRAAARHLRHLYDQFGDWYLAMAAYNAGPLRVSRAMEASGAADFWTLSERRLLPQETRDYVPTILAMAVIGRDPARYGFEILEAAPLSVERVSVDQATDLRVIAEILELPLDQIQRLNPHVLRWATPPADDEFELILPSGYAGVFLERVAPLAEQQRILFRYHVVSGGETLSYLARRYAVPVAAIARANGLADAHMIRIGQSLVIPLSGVTPDAGLIASAEAPGQDPEPPNTYRIRRGDTLSGIAERFGLSVQQIRSWNAMSSNLLIAGDTLRLSLPSAAIETATTGPSLQRVVYRVRPGDTLTRIALSHQTSVDALRAWNREADLSTIHPGDPITIYLQR